MKSILFTTDECNEPRDVHGHELEKLFFRLPQNDRDKIRAFVDSRDANEYPFEDRLGQSLRAFEKLRYAYEADVLELDFLLTKHVDNPAMPCEETY